MKASSFGVASCKRASMIFSFRSELKRRKYDFAFALPLGVLFRDLIGGRFGETTASSVVNIVGGVTEYATQPTRDSRDTPRTIETFCV